MQFETPTTIDELYSTLNDIYNYYRLQPEIFTAADLEPLNLTRMSFTPLTDAQLEVKARENVAAAQRLRLMNYVENLREKVDEIVAKIEAENIAETFNLSINEQTFNAAKEAVSKRALKTNTTDSSVYSEKISALEKERGEKAAEITAKRSANVFTLNQKKWDLLTLINGAEIKFSEVCELEVVAEFNKLKAEQDKTAREVFEYNNALDEKEQRYENSRKQHIATMQLRHMEIRMQGYSKDELVQRGYYNDVIKCITDYYNTMTAAEAYRSVRAQARLAIYLDDYYTDIAYFYKINAE